MSLLRKLQQAYNRQTRTVNWNNLRNTKPVSEVFGLDRGTPVDRFYIESFLRQNSRYIKGSVLEIAESTYSKKFGAGVASYEVLHYNKDNTLATIVGDLARIETLPENAIDCFICTQTFHCIYNFRDAIAGARHLLKKDGILLATLPGISQISRYDMDRWGDYWRFTTLSAKMAFEEVFGKEQVQIDFFGNVLSAVAFLEGLSVEDLTPEELNVKDHNYQMIITVVARK